MIITEQERDALMAAIDEFGSVSVLAVIHPEMRPQIDKKYAAIRAMLTPDDAVAIPRELAERAADALESISEISAISTQHKTQCAADAKSMKEFLQ